MMLFAATPELASAVTTPVSFSSLQPQTTQCLTPGLDPITAPERFCASTGELSVPTSITWTPGSPAFPNADLAAWTRSVQTERSCLYALMIFVSAAVQPAALNSFPASVPTESP